MRSALKNIVGERVCDSKTRDFVWNDQRPSCTGNHLCNDAVQLHGILCSRELRAQPRQARCAQSDTRTNMYKISVRPRKRTRAAFSPETPTKN